MSTASKDGCVHSPLAAWPVCCQQAHASKVEPLQKAVRVVAANHLACSARKINKNKEE